MKRFCLFVALAAAFLVGAGAAHVSKGANPIEHLALRVAEPAAMIDWWVKNLGFKVTLRREGGSAFIADAGGTFALEVYGPEPEHPAPDYRQMDILQLHFGFASDDVEADIKRLVAAGATLLVHNVTPGLEEAVLRDPFGLVVQFVKRRKSILH